MAIEYDESDDTIWFDDGEYIGTEISFPFNSVWRLDVKIREHSYIEPQRECEDLHVNSEARGAFICSKVSGNGPPTAIVKIRLQSVPSTSSRKYYRGRERERETDINGQDSVVENSEAKPRYSRQAG
ncbi:uncharacterized protein LDX57_011405 [Aspergillus melleus]|uniref:uncharacterized protein n=1 Tax=Aspergillus melleus TaxID=138277 RepID=UPI001E8DF4E7|nr:uncharacterized protein LDX57_011405 [Aspergillus melleus]KAH8433771.1 hypothetical protein LDX57_011405 [Aspergillus melleus]